MSQAIYPSVVFSVLLIAVTTYYLLGGLPLLILKHDVALDARFIRSFFGWYYRIALFAAAGATLSFLAWGRPALAAGAAAIGAVTFVVRRRVMPGMLAAGDGIQTGDLSSVLLFRRLHGTALGVNAVQLLVLIWGTTYLPL